jgi:hypothetical protein
MSHSGGFWKSYGGTRVRCVLEPFSEHRLLLAAGHGSPYRGRGHVYDGYLDGKQKSGAKNIVCQIDNIPFDPEAKLHSYNRGLDIATFGFSYDDLIKMGKQAISGFPWPPPEHIPEELAVWFGGFPGINRLWIGSNKMSLGISMGHVPITTVTLRQITCRFDREPAGWRGRPVP